MHVELNICRKMVWLTVCNGVVAPKGTVHCLRVCITYRLCIMPLCYVSNHPHSVGLEYIYDYRVDVMVILTFVESRVKRVIKGEDYNGLF